jgi:hypothetical protein
MTQAYRWRVRGGLGSPGWQNGSARDWEGGGESGETLYFSLVAAIHFSLMSPNSLH